MRNRIAVVAMVGMLVGCGADPAGLSATSGGPPSSVDGTPAAGAPAAGGRSDAAEEAGGELSPPPDVVVRGDGGPVVLHPYTFCYGNGCADGNPPESPPSVGSAPEVTVEFPLPDWTFSATFKAAGEPCAREQVVELERTAAGRFLLRPAGPAGTYQVDLFGQGDGDLFVRFLWSTPVDGPLAVPEARLAVLADHDGRVDSYGVELAIANMASTPATATATVTVTAADGEALTFDAVRAPAMQACGDLEGWLYWDGPDASGTAAAALGPAPFTYEVVLTLDGVRHVATAVWPDDEIDGNEPSVALTFRPPLPALAG